MKKLKLILFVCLMSSAIVSCNKREAVPATGNTAAAAAGTTTGLLQSFSHLGRTFTFHYDRDGMIDSVVLDPTTTYRVAHRGRIIDSISRYKYGYWLELSRKDIEYDLAGRITGYSLIDYSYDARAHRYDINYSAENDITIFETDYINNFRDTLEYDSNHNAIKDITKTPYGIRTDTYKHDNFVNPLKQLPAYMLWAEEARLAYWLSDNNVIQYTTNLGIVTNYTNLYDQQNRIIKSIGQGNDNSERIYTYY